LDLLAEFQVFLVALLTGGKYRAERVESCLARSQYARDLGDEVLHVRKLVCNSLASSSFCAIIALCLITRLTAITVRTETLYLLHHHQLVHPGGKWVAHAIDVIASQVNQHHL
jgi:hypothetical protein